ncbi:MAG TPA: N-acetylmuramoyl-L-alanine amidase [Flavisolibacter sp.]|nr:N-acetylmuramoyl-L-alanine amidase [Flavisolibacter sp.]
MKNYYFVLLSLVLSTGCSSSKKITTGNDAISIQPRSAWNAAPPKPYKTHVPVQLTVHHEGTRLEPTADAAKKIKAIQTWGMGPDRSWTDIPYHFLIAPNGTVYEGRDVFTVGETATEYDPTGHLLITCLGNLEQQEVPKEQLASLIKLLAHCSETYKLPLHTLATHRDHSTQTTCPGKNLYAYFSNGYIMKEAAKLVLNQK